MAVPRTAEQDQKLQQTLCEIGLLTTAGVCVGRILFRALSPSTMPPRTLGETASAGPFRRLSTH